MRPFPLHFLRTCGLYPWLVHFQSKRSEELFAGQACRERLGALFVAEASEAGLEAHQERGAPRLSDLVNKGAAFDVWCDAVPIFRLFPVHLGRFGLISGGKRQLDPPEGPGSLSARHGRKKHTQSGGCLRNIPLER